MKRVSVEPRSNWKSKVESLGFTYHSINDDQSDPRYWDERNAYEFTSDQIDMLDDATQELYNMCMSATNYVVKNNLYGQLGIPQEWAPVIERSWDRQDLDLYGRFDFLMGEDGIPKMLEFNADTPTGLLESSVIQWFWLEDLNALDGIQRDQFNSLHENLVEAWKHIGERLLGSGESMYFSTMKDVEEDFITLTYLRDCAEQAGLKTQHIDIEDIGWNNFTFTDLDEKPINTIFKLYPWEWMIREDFGKHIRNEPWDMLEPAWKMILSNKAILAVLWKLFPDHPLLLPSFFDSKPLGHTYVRKPFLSREGANVEIVRNGEAKVHHNLGYGAEGHVYQQLLEAPDFDGNNPVLGSWVVAGRSSGIGIREDASKVTSNQSRFVPHYFV